MAHAEALSPVSAVGSTKSWHTTDIESLLSEKLLEGYSLLDTSCPQCVTPLVRRKTNTIASPRSNQPVSKGTSPHIFMSFATVQPQPAADDTVTDSSVPIVAPFSPVSGVPFCVLCKAHVVTRDADMQALERCNSLKNKGSIIVAIEEDRQDYEVSLPERPFSSTRAFTAPSIRDEAEQEDPAFEANLFGAREEQCFFVERDMSPLLEVNNTSFKKQMSPRQSPKMLSPAQSSMTLSPVQSLKTLSPAQSSKIQVHSFTVEDAEREDAPAFNEAIIEERDMAPAETPLRVETDFEEELDTIAVKTLIEAPDPPTSETIALFARSPKHKSPSPVTVLITTPVNKLLLSADPEDDDEEALPEDEVPKTKLPEEEAEEGIEQDLNEHKRTMVQEAEEGIEQDLNEHQRTMGIFAERAAHTVMLPPRPVTSDLLDPTEKEELDNERKKSLAPSCFVEATGFSDAPAADVEVAETDKTLHEYSARREIATKVLGSKMLQGYSLVEEQCLKCGMPLMKNKGQIDCVVCPVLVKKAKKKMKEQEEERTLAERKAKVEAKMAAQKEAEEEAATMAKAEEKAALAAKIKAKEEAAIAKAKAEQEEAVVRAVAEKEKEAEEAERRAAEEAGMRGIAKAKAEQKEATARAIAKAKEEAQDAAEEAELMFAFTDQDLFGAEEEARLAEEERLLHEASFGRTFTDQNFFCADVDVRLEEVERLPQGPFDKTDPVPDKAAKAKFDNEIQAAEEKRAALEKQEEPFMEDNYTEEEVAFIAVIQEEPLMEEEPWVEEEEPLVEENEPLVEENEPLVEEEDPLVEKTHMEEEVALSVVVQEALQGPVTEEQIALRAALDALHAAQEEERLAQEAAEEDSILEDILTMEQEALRVAEEEERLALQLLEEAEEAERLCLEALRAAEEEEQMAIEIVSVTTNDADEKKRLALEAFKRAEEEEHLTEEEEERLALQLLKEAKEAEALTVAEEEERLTQEVIRAEEEKILAEKAVEDARLALEKARVEMDQKKLRDTEAMRKEQARMAYHTRLEEEVRRAAEIAIAEKARGEAEEEMRREELERQAAEEAAIIEALENEANKKSKAAEAAWLEAKAALDQVSNVRRKILQKTIAQAEVDVLAEAEEIVVSQNEGYKEPPQLPPTRSEIEAEQWETLRCEGRAQMTRRMLQGWTMLPELCRGHECANTPLLLSKDGRKVQCVVCDGCGNGIDGVYEAIDATYERDDEIEDDEEAGDTDSLVEEASDTDSYDDDASTTTEKESFEEPSVSLTLVGTTQSQSTPTATQSVDKLKEDFETKRAYVSKEIGRKMMQGWTLLDMSCDACMMPLMYNPDRDEETCVLCGTAVRALPTMEEPTFQKKNDQPEDPPTAQEEIEKNNSPEDSPTAKEEENNIPEDPPTADENEDEHESSKPSENQEEEKLESSILKKENLDTHILLVEGDPKKDENNLPEVPPTADENEGEHESSEQSENKEEKREETLCEEKLKIDRLDEEEMEIKIQNLSSTASKDIADFLLAVPTAIEEADNQSAFGCDNFEVTKEVAIFPQLQAKSEETVVSEQPDVIEEQCEIEVAVIVSLAPDESPMPSPTMQEEEGATASNTGEQPEIPGEDDHTIKLMVAASSFSAPSFDEAYIHVVNPMDQSVKKQEKSVHTKKPTANNDKEDRGEELVVVTSVVAPSSFDEAYIPLEKPATQSVNMQETSAFTKKPTADCGEEVVLVASVVAPSSFDEPHIPMEKKPTTDIDEEDRDEELIVVTSVAAPSSFDKTQPVKMQETPVLTKKPTAKTDEEDCGEELIVVTSVDAPSSFDEAHIPAEKPATHPVKMHETSVLMEEPTADSGEEDCGEEEYGEEVVLVASVVAPSSFDEPHILMEKMPTTDIDEEDRDEELILVTSVVTPSSFDEASIPVEKPVAPLVKMQEKSVLMKKSTADSDEEERGEELIAVTSIDTTSSFDEAHIPVEKKPTTDIDEEDRDEELIVRTSVHAPSSFDQAHIPAEKPAAPPVKMQEKSVLMKKSTAVSDKEERGEELIAVTSIDTPSSFDEAHIPVEKPATQPVKKQETSFLTKKPTADSSEEEHGEEVVLVASVVAPSSFDEAHIPVKKPKAHPFKKQDSSVLMKKPTADIDEEDRGKELIVVPSVVAPSFDKERISVAPPLTALRPPRPDFRVSPPSMKRTVAKSPKKRTGVKSPKRLTRAKRGPPKPEGKSSPMRPVPRFIDSSSRRSPRLFNSNHSARGFEMDDEDSVGSSRMESVANSTLDAILNRIEDCKKNLNESSHTEFIMTQLAMIEKLSTAAMAVRKLEELG